MSVIHKSYCHYNRSMAPLPTPQQARENTACGIESEIAKLREFDLGKRMIEIIVLVALWPSGAALALWSAWQVEALWLQVIGIAVGMTLSALALNAYVLLMHESMHGTLFRGRWANRWVGVLFGSTVLMSRTAYQVMHLRHHDFLGDPRDPDDYHNYSHSRLLVWTLHFVRLTVGAFLYLLMIPLLSWRHATASERIKIVQKYTLLLGVYVTVAILISPLQLLLVWFAPVCLVALMTNIRGFTQHGIGTAADPYLASRTMKPPRLVQLLLLNENYHLEHHLFPEVPSYHLDRLHRLIWPRLPRALAGRSYLAFVFRFLRATASLDERPIGVVQPAEAAGPDCDQSQ
jgi:fatty acid desaturase